MLFTHGQRLRLTPLLPSAIAMRALVFATHPGVILKFVLGWVFTLFVSVITALFVIVMVEMMRTLLLHSAVMHVVHFFPFLLFVKLCISFTLGLVNTLRSMMALRRLIMNVCRFAVF